MSSMVAVVGDLEQLVDGTDPRLDLRLVCGAAHAVTVMQIGSLSGHPAGERADRLVGLIEGEAVRVEQSRADTSRRSPWRCRARKPRVMGAGHSLSR